jgi:hypothetical protein
LGQSIHPFGFCIDGIGADEGAAPGVSRTAHVAIAVQDRSPPVQWLIESLDARHVVRRDHQLAVIVVVRGKALPDAALNSAARRGPRDGPRLAQRGEQDGDQHGDDGDDDQEFDEREGSAHGRRILQRAGSLHRR